MEQKKIYLVTKGFTKTGISYPQESRIALSRADAEQYSGSIQLILSENPRTFIDDVVPEVGEMTPTKPTKKRRVSKKNNK